MRRKTQSKDLQNVTTFVRAASDNGLPADEFVQIRVWASSGDSSTPFVFAFAHTHSAQNDNRATSFPTLGVMCFPTTC